MTPNNIAGYIAGWFGSIPSGLFLPLATDGDGAIVVNEAARNKTNEAKAVAWLDTAIAIVLAESNGNPAAKNGNASGLWQIMASVHGDLIKDAIVAVNAETGKSEKLDVFDPRVNTFVAGRLYSSRGWQPWEVFTNGAYKKHTGHGKKAWDFINSPKMRQKQWTSFQANMIDNESYADLAGSFGAVTPLGLLDRGMAFAKSAGLTIGVFLIALVVIILGLVIVLSDTKVGKVAVKGATKGVL
jgi:hypothetical protein